MDDKEHKQIEKIIEIYNKPISKILRFWLLMGNTVFPPLSILSYVADDIIHNIENKKVQELIVELKNRQMNMEDFLNKVEQSQEWEELVQHAVVKAIRCSKQQQIRLIVDILQGKYEADNENSMSFGDAEDLINIVSELSTNEAQCLREIYQYCNNNQNDDFTYKDMHSDIDKTMFWVGRLNGKGLIRKNEEKGQPIRANRFILTEAGKSLCKVSFKYEI